MLPRWTLGLLGAATIAAAASCAAIAGLGDYQSGNAEVDASFADAFELDGAFDAGFDVPQLPSCGSGFVCFETFDGWAGPFEIALEGGAAPPAACPDGGLPYEQAMLKDLVVPDASCPCSCTSQVTCSATFTVWNGAGCSTTAGAVCGQGAPDDAGCLALSCTQLSVSASANLDPSTCTPKPGSDIPEAGFSTNAYACESVTVDSGACEVGSICSGAPGQGFEPGLCIRKQGENPCPEGSPYPFPRVYYKGFLDNRVCAGCGCDVIEEAGCTYSLDYHGASNCNQNAMGGGSLTAGTCHDSSFTSGFAPHAVSVGFPLSNGDAACSAGDASLQGEAGPDPAGAVTYCCTHP
jgi:hypothetical protein